MTQPCMLDTNVFNDLRGGSKPRAAHLSQMRDVLIAETAMKIDVTLLSGDRNLCTAVTDCGGRAQAPRSLL